MATGLENLRRVDRGGRLRSVLARTLWLGVALALGSSWPPLRAAGTAAVFDVRQMGAAGDGKTSDTRAIASAIEACAASGGGLVLLPPGTYLSGTVRLRSNVTLKLEAGARLIGTSDLGEYQHFAPPPEAPEARNLRWHRALVLLDGVEDVAIVGPGTIDGNKVFDPSGEERMRGPHTILVGRSRRVRLEDLWIRDSANYAVMVEFSDEVEVRRARITGGWDGVHFRGWKGSPCRDLKIVQCEFFTGDDAIAGRYLEGLVVSGCLVNSSCNGVRIIGPLKNFVIQDCLFWGPGLHPHRTSGRRNMLSGILLQPGAWDPCEGAVEDGLISQVTMKGVASPVTMWLKRPGNALEGISVSRLTATGIYRSAVSVESWTDAPIGRVTFRGCDFEFGPSPKETVEAPSMPGVDARALPAWGFYARNVREVRLEDVRFGCAEGEKRTGLSFERVGRLLLEGVKVGCGAGGAEPVAFEEVESVEFGARAISPAQVEYLNLEAEVGPGSSEKTGKASVAARVTVRAATTGVAKVELEVSGSVRSKWEWLEAGRAKTVWFRGLEAAAQGPLRLRAGGLERTLGSDP